MVVVRLCISYQLFLKYLFFASPAPRRAVQKKQKPFLAGRDAPSRSRRQGRAVCVHWSEAKALDGGSARPRRRVLSGRADKGRQERRMMTEPNNRKGPGSAPGLNRVFSQNGASSDSAVGSLGGVGSSCSL